jgi:hypothetical protein
MGRRRGGGLRREREATQLRSMSNQQQMTEECVGELYCVGRECVRAAQRDLVCVGNVPRRESVHGARRRQHPQRYQPHLPREPARPARADSPRYPASESCEPREGG